MSCGMLERVSKSALWALLCLCFGQVARAGEETIGEIELNLDTPVTAIYPAGENSFLTLSERGVLELRLLDDGTVLDKMTLKGTPVFASDGIFSRGIR